MTSPKEEAATQPRLGAFIVMTVILLLFFGMVSKVEDIAGKTGLLSIKNSRKKMDARSKLEKKRAEVMAVIGRGVEPVRESRRGVSGEGVPETIPLYPDRSPTPENTDNDSPQRQQENQGYPDFPAANPRPRVRQTYRVQRGDTLRKIAGKTLGNANLYSVIEAANPGVMENGRFYIGAVLVIPAKDQQRVDATPSRRSRYRSRH